MADAQWIISTVAGTGEKGYAGDGGAATQALLNNPFNPNGLGSGNTLGTNAGVSVACILAVSDTFSPDGARRRIEDGALLAAVERMGAAAADALGG